MVQSIQEKFQAEFVFEEFKLEENVDVTVIEFMLYNDCKELIEQVLEKLGKACKDILKLWAENYSFKEIAESLDIENVGTARKRKFDCKNKLDKYLDDNPKIKKTLKECFHLD